MAGVVVAAEVVAFGAEGLALVCVLVCSAESDYFSSNYNTSQSDTTSRGSRDYATNQSEALLLPPQQPPPSLAHAHVSSESRSNYASTSDRSNDTFSEYDLQPGDAYDVDECDSSSQLEYEYYLAKARHHNVLKNNVKRILSSESERSDVERGGGGGGASSDGGGCGGRRQPDDTISLTSVTSLSEMSCIPTEEAILDRLSCRARPPRHHQHHQHHHVKTTSSSLAPKHSHKHASNDALNKTPSPVNGIKPQTRTRKPIRKKRKANKMEYYKLPNFGSNNSTEHSSSDKSDVTICEAPLQRDFTRSKQQ